MLANDTGLTDTPLNVSLVAAAGVTGNARRGRIAGRRNHDPPLRTRQGQVAGVDAIGYQVIDNGGDMDSATAYVEVLPPVVPIAVDDVADSFRNEQSAINVLANDQSLDDEPLVVDVVTPPANGRIGAIIGCTSAPGNCEVPYIPDPGFAGVDTFEYTVTDSTPDVSNVATVTVNVQETPVAIEDAAATTNSTPIAIDVLANDEGLAFAPLTVKALPLASFLGDAVVQPDNTILFTPSGGNEREDVFDYEVTDANGKSSIGRVRVSLVPVQQDLPGESSASATGPFGLGFLVLLTWLRRRH